MIHNCIAMSRQWFCFVVCCFILLLGTVQSNESIHKKPVIIGISIQKFDAIREIFQISGFSLSKFHLHLCFDWPTGEFVSDDLLFQHLQTYHMTIQRFQPESSPCAQKYAQAQQLKSWHIIATNSGWSKSLLHRINQSIYPHHQRESDYESKSIDDIDGTRYADINRNNFSIYPVASNSNCVSKTNMSVRQQSPEQCKQQHTCNEVEKVENENILERDIAMIHRLKLQIQSKQKGHKLRQGSCQLWWPWNHSEIFLHQPVPEHLSMIRIRTKTIIHCDIPDNMQLANIPAYLELVDCLTDSQCEQSTSTIFQLSDREVFNNPPNHLLHDVESMLHISSSQTSTTPKAHHLRILSFAGDELSRFIIHQNVVYGHLDNHGRNRRYAYIHPMAAQLDGRDDLGFALSSLLSPQTMDDDTKGGNLSKVWVEVGVQSGEFAELMMRTTTADEIQTYVGIDPWRTWPEDMYIDVANTHFGGDESHQHFRHSAEHRLSYPSLGKEHDYLTGRNRFLIAQPSTSAALLFADESVDIVYLDAMHHYLAVWDDILAWWPKVKPCGLLAGHDYLLTTVQDQNAATIFTVKPAVQEFARHMQLLLLQTQEVEYPSFPTWLLFKSCE